LTRVFGLLMGSPRQQEDAVRRANKMYARDDVFSRRTLRIPFRPASPKPKTDDMSILDSSSKQPELSVDDMLARFDRTLVEVTSSLSEASKSKWLSPSSEYV
jgi:hypothetical protein